MVGRNLDLQRIRKQYRVTQQRLAELTSYPQSFISQIENGRVGAPDAFVVKLKEALGIADVDQYFIPSADDRAANTANSSLEGRLIDQQATINRLLDMIERRDERIRELENEMKRLHAIIFASPK